MNKAILSILGRDRPGIVATVARVLFEQGCNIENVSQTMLQGRVRRHFLVCLPNGLTAGESTVHEALFKPAVAGLHVHTKPCESRRRRPRAAKPSEPFVITTRGPGPQGPGRRHLPGHRQLRGQHHQPAGVVQRRGRARRQHDDLRGGRPA